MCVNKIVYATYRRLLNKGDLKLAGIMDSFHSNRNNSEKILAINVFDLFA